MRALVAPWWRETYDSRKGTARTLEITTEYGKKAPMSLGREGETYRLSLSIVGAEELITDLTEHIAWSKHPLYQWAQRKTGDKNV